MNYAVVWTAAALDDLKRLEEFLDRAAHESIDATLSVRAVRAIRCHVDRLKGNPFICRRAETDPSLRELVIPFGRSGYVALIHVLDPAKVAVVAIRHQRENKFY